jgi:hypothetical protein
MPGPEKPSLDGLEGEAEHLCSFSNVKLLDVAEHEYLAIDLGQCLNRLD